MRRAGRKSLLFIAAAASCLIVLGSLTARLHKPDSRHADGGGTTQPSSAGSFDSSTIVGTTVPDPATIPGRDVALQMNSQRIEGPPRDVTRESGPTSHTRPSLRDDLPKSNYRTILDAQTDDLVVHVYSTNPNILVFDFPSLLSQAKALNRVSILVESVEGARHRVLDDEELQGLLYGQNQAYETFNLGHDYRAEDLARFFTLALSQDVALNAEEIRLLDILEEHGAIEKTGTETYRSTNPEVAVISIAQISRTSVVEGNTLIFDERLRETVLRHELSHGEYFTNTAYRSYCHEFWNHVLNGEDRRAIRAILRATGYDSSNEDLVVNEMQAFLGHTPDKRIFGRSSIGTFAERIDRLSELFWRGLRTSGLYRNFPWSR